jgi:DNA-binding FadR family transcriptional regulator
MLHHPTNPIQNESANLLTLRRWFKLTQREFIDTYLTDAQGEPLISAATLSGVENGTQNNLAPLLAALSARLRVDIDVFAVDPDVFAKNVDLFFIRPAGLSGREADATAPLLQVISEDLADAIADGTLKPGDQLPSERALSTRFGVGRGAVREALKVLEALGLVTIQQGQGTFLAMESGDFYTEPLSWTLFIGQQGTGHLLDVRTLLEVEAAGHAALCADAAALELLSAQYRQMQEAHQTANYKNFLDADLGFHLAIARCSGNPIIHNLLRTSRRLLSRISQSGMAGVAQIDEIAAEHYAIYEAISHCDAEQAVLEMRAHLENARRRYRAIV